MKCSEARKFLSAFVDDELDVRTNVELIEHVEMCDTCMERIERLRGVKGAVEAHIAGVSAPEGLKNRILQGLREADGRRKRVETAIKAVAHSRWFGASAAAASILVVAGFVYLFLLSPRAAFNNKAVLAHVAVLHDEVPSFYFTGDVERARRLALFRMENKPEVPLLDADRFELVGAGPAEIAFKDVGHFVFRYRAVTLSMFVFQGLSLDEVRGRLRESALGPVRLEKRGNLTLLAWRRGASTYILVGELPEEQLLAIVEPRQPAS